MKSSFIAVLAIARRRALSVALPRPSSPVRGRPRARPTTSAFRWCSRTWARPRSSASTTSRCRDSGKRHGRSTSFGKWALKGNDVLVTYSKITDRLRYSDRESLSAVGQTGERAGAQAGGQADREQQDRHGDLVEGTARISRQSASLPPAPAVRARRTPASSPGAPVK